MPPRPAISRRSMVESPLLRYSRVRGRTQRAALSPERPHSVLLPRLVRRVGVRSGDQHDDHVLRWDCELVYWRYERALRAPRALHRPPLLYWPARAASPRHTPTATARSLVDPLELTPRRRQRQHAPRQRSELLRPKPEQECSSSDKIRLPRDRPECLLLVELARSEIGQLTELSRPARRGSPALASR